MSDLLPCPFCGGANLGLLRHVSYFPHGVMCRDCFSSATSIERWSARALPVARADAAAIREAALRDALDAAAAETDRLRAAKKKHAHKSDIKGWAMAEGAFQVATALAGLIDKTRKEVMPDVRQYQDTAHDTAPAGLSAGGGAGWQPIKTAPRDGSRFLGYWPSSGRDDDVAVTTWWDAFGFWESPFEAADYGADYGPTRWMPHPPATKGSE